MRMRVRKWAGDPGAHTRNYGKIRLVRLLDVMTGAWRALCWREVRSIDHRYRVQALYMYWACAGLQICCQQRQAMQCPLFTERHAHHSSVWTIPGFSMPQLCLACATERLEDRSGVPLHCRRVLSEFQALLTTNCNSLVCAFSSDKRVLDHFSSVVFGMISIQYISYMYLHVHVPPEAAHFS